MDYSCTLDYLFNSLPVFEHNGATAYKPGLERMEALDTILGFPHRNYFTIHVAGTNGKGSVSHILASILTAAGYRVGLYTSPHLTDFRERIMIGSETISCDEVVAFVERYKSDMERLELSFFEMTAAMAFDHFSRHGVEVAVVETGLGGRLDATNIITPILSIITNIGLDHTDLLGGSIAAIATEKAGIIKRGVPVVIGESDKESLPVFAAAAEGSGSEMVVADSAYSCATVSASDSAQSFVVHTLQTKAQRALELDLLGEYQGRNIVTVVAAVDLLNRCSRLNISRRALAHGCGSVRVVTGLRGRWEVLGHSPLIVCDTGHNDHGLRYVSEQISHQKYRDLYIVFGMVKDKDVSKVLPLLPHTARYFFTQPSIGRALDAEHLRDAAASYGLTGEVAGNVAEAFARAKGMAGEEDMIFIGGSTFVVADLLRSF